MNPFRNRNGSQLTAPGASRDPRDRDSEPVMIAGMSYELGQGTGPLKGVKVVEIAGIGPGRTPA